MGSRLTGNQDISFEDYVRQFDKVPVSKQPIIAYDLSPCLGSMVPNSSQIQNHGQTRAEVYHGAEHLGEIALPSECMNIFPQVEHATGSLRAAQGTADGGGFAENLDRRRVGSGAASVGERTGWTPRFQSPHRCHPG